MAQKKRVGRNKGVVEDERERDGKSYSEFSDSMSSLVGAKPSLMGG